MKVITWVDLQGRYRVTSPAYDSLKRLHGFDEAQALAWTWKKLVEQEPNGIAYSDVEGIRPSKYNIKADHPHFLVEDTDQRTRVTDCCGTYFRYGALMIPNREGMTNSLGTVILVRDARDGAWEMDTEGLPNVNMPKARGVQMDFIRMDRNTKLVVLDGLQNRAMGRGDNVERDRLEAQKQILRDIPQTFDLTTRNDTPMELRAMWPAELL